MEGGQYKPEDWKPGNQKVNKRNKRNNTLDHLKKSGNW